MTKARALASAGLLAILVACLPACTRSPAESTAQPPGSVSPASSTLPTVIPTGVPSIPPAVAKPDMANRIVPMLKAIPDVADARAILQFTDFASWRSALGVDVDLYRKMDQGEEKYIDYFVTPVIDHFPTPNPWVGNPPFIAGMGEAFGRDASGSLIRARNIGYGPLDVDRTVEAGSDITPTISGSYEAIYGSFDIGTIKSITGQYADPYLRPVLANQGDIDILSWSTQERLAGQAPIYDNYGRGRTLAVQANSIFGSLHKDWVYQMIDASLDNADSLADNPQFLEMAQQLEAMGTMSVLMSDVVLSRASYLQQFGTLTPYLIDFFARADLYAPLLGRYVAYASGLGLDERGLFVSLVLVYGSSDEAAADVETFKKRLAFGVDTKNNPWSEDIVSSLVWADGKALCAQLRGNVTGYWRDLVLEEPLLVRVD